MDDFSKFNHIVKFETVKAFRFVENDRCKVALAISLEWKMAGMCPDRLIYLKGGPKP